MAGGQLTGSLRPTGGAAARPRPPPGPLFAALVVLLKNHLAVAVQHDNKPCATSVQNVNPPDVPSQDFPWFFNNYLARAEDVPVALYIEVVSSIVFALYNFFGRA
ncbi:hypothetical protein VUR80DRAFT_4074 [Thermomyces stellatus]